MRIESTEFAVTGHWNGGWDERGLQAWAEALRAKCPGSPVSLGLVFLTPQLFSQAAQVLEILRVHARIPLLVGCSSTSLIIGGQEVEDEPGIVAGLYHLPGADLKGFYFSQAQIEEANGPAYWHQATGIAVDQTNGWLVFADPFHLDSERWLTGWNEAYAPLPILGGLASGDAQEQQTQVYLNGQVWDEGGVAVSVGGAVRMASVISQGCTPIGETWTITKAEGNLIHEIGNRPAYQVLVETFNGLPREQQKRAQGNLFVGLVINEYQDEFHRGDFLVRNLLGGDPVSGILAVGARPRAGQSLRFQCRDATAATEDMVALLRRAREQTGEARVYGGCLCCCNGRGRRFFKQPNHDAALAQDHLGPLPLTGFFCNGEIGPVGDRNFLHGYTASLALFVQKS
jgi:small ligand-binding sensory domain FIST